ncbi:LPXTG cell wall anchor domain-containing protein [Corynebacterium diphtheriae]|nr:LPXTG cell wall anchor domain-containing protein [Corynebacterium diphtheriae]CAB0627791.1 LPXTG cell wall anchor domain-containing protein [Corynebacterium diphtheriae]
MFSTQKFSRATAALCLGGILAVSTPVVADAKVISGYAGASVRVDPTTIGDEPNSLTITLPKGNPFDELRPGELPPSSLSGYTFTLKRVADIDIRTRDGYDSALRLTVDEARDRGFTDPTLSRVSDEQGKVRFGGLPAGVYLTEVKPPARAGEKHENICPMLIILPATNEDGSWLHELSVKAKAEDGGGDVPPPTDIPDPRPTPTPTPTRDRPITSTSNTPGITTSPVPNPSTDKPGNPSSGRLAKTGASVLGIVAVGALLLLLGGYVMRRNNKGEQR